MMTNERRQHRRYSLNCSAAVEDQDRGLRACRFRDVSEGGALVVLAAGAGADSGGYSKGDLLRVRFSPRREASGDLSHSVTARVVRVASSGLGLSFVNAPIPTLRLLTRLAGTEGEALQDLGEALRGTLATFLQEVAGEFAKQLDRGLFETARAAANDRDSRAYFDALRQFRDRRAVWERELAAATITESTRQTVASGLSLIEKDTFEDLLAGMACLERCEREHAQTFLEYRRAGRALRHSALAGLAPPSPEAAVTRIAESVRALELEAQVRPQVHEALNQALQPALHRYLEHTLAAIRQHGLTAPSEDHADTSTPDPAPRNEPPTGLSDPAHDDAPGVDFERQVVRPHPEAHEASPGAGAAPHYRAGRKDAYPELDLPPATGTRRSGAVEPQGLNAPSIPTRAPQDLAPGATTPGEVSSQATLSGLARRLVRRGLAGSSSDGAGPTSAADRAWRRALADAASLEQPALDTLDGQLSPLSFLPQQFPELANHPPSGSLLEALRLSDAFWRSVYNDPWLHPVMNRELGRLRTWLTQLALEDPEWMLRSQHPVAQAIDLLGATWPSDERHPGREAASALIDHLLAMPAGDALDMEASLPWLELGRIANQDQTHSRERLRALLQECNEQEALVQRRRRGEGRESAGAAVHPSLQQWVGLARQWRPGDSGLLSRGRKRLAVSLAWVSQDEGSWVFADRGGERAVTMTLQELALALNRGQLTRAHHAGLRLTERARANMLDVLAEDSLRALEAPESGPGGGPVAKDPDATLPLKLADLEIGLRGARLVGEPLVQVGRFVACTEGQHFGGNPGRYLELAWATDSEQGEPLIHPELSLRLAKEGRRTELDLWLWSFVLQRAGEDDGFWALRLAASTLADAAAHQALLTDLLEAPVAPSRISLVVDALGGTPIPGLGEILHGLHELGLKIGMDVTDLPLERWRGLPVDSLWVTPPQSGTDRDGVLKVSTLADMASFAGVPLIGLGDSQGMAREALAELGLTWSLSEQELISPKPSTTRSA